jgi:hypothetical protein
MTTKPTKHVTLRMPADLLRQIDAEAAKASARTGLRIDRSQIIRQAVTMHLGGAARIKKGAKP